MRAETIRISSSNEYTYAGASWPHEFSAVCSRAGPRVTSNFAPAGMWGRKLCVDRYARERASEMLFLESSIIGKLSKSKWFYYPCGFIQRVLGHGWTLAWNLAFLRVFIFFFYNRAWVKFMFFDLQLEAYRCVLYTLIFANPVLKMFKY